MPESQEPNKSLGMGGEAVENAHAAQQNAASTGAEGSDRAGSEPPAKREEEHVSGYGGMLGAARTSANEHEVVDPLDEKSAVGGENV